MIQHTPDTRASDTLAWLKNNKLNYSHVMAFEGEKIPTVDEVDFLIVLGGGMNIDDEKNHPFLREEKKLVEQVLKAEKSFLGLCLGGQMLARVMGAEVRKHSEWEVGWHPIQVENKVVGLEARPEREEIHFYQWHEDTFDLPKGALPFAKNHITPNQGFVTANRAAVATQFHPEADEAWVRLCISDPSDFPSGKYVQTPEEHIAGLKHLPKQSSWYFDLLTHLARRAQKQVQG